MSETSSGIAVPLVQEADSARSPRDEGGIAAPTSLLKVLSELHREKAIVPSRHFTRLLQEEAQIVRLRTACEDEPFGLGAAAAAAAVAASAAADPSLKTRPPLLTQLVEHILDFCRLKLLDKDLVEPELGASADPSHLTEEDREERLAKHLRRCTETYGQMLLVHSDSPCRAKLSTASSIIGSSSSRARKGTELSPPRVRTTEVADGDIDKLAATSPLTSPMGSVSKAPRNVPQPTGFFETVYAVVARAVQQGMRAIAEGTKLSQEKGGMAQLALRVEEELGWLFRSQEFGRSRGHGLRKGGAKADVGGSSEGVESAQLAARAEAGLGKLIKSAAQLSTRLDSEFRDLEKRLKRHNQEEAKQAADQADKTPAADNKEAVVDHGASHGSADRVIAVFWSRAFPKKNRADHTSMLQHVVTTRSPMINSLMPSPHDQALGVQLVGRCGGANQRVQTARATCKRAQLSGSHIINHAKAGSTMPSEALADSGATPAFKNTWALSQERVVHNVAKPHPPPPVLWFASPKVPKVL